MARDSLNIYDIAEKAGVSIATVSRVLSGSDKVREPTRRKVLAVMDATGYTPNAFARGLGLGTMRMVGILCTEISDLFYAHAVSTLERSLREHGLDTLLYCTGSRLEDKKRCMDQLLAKNADAVILVGSAFQEQQDNSHIEQAAGQAPVIIINGLVECAGVTCVLCDEYAAMRENVALLSRQGCRHIAYLYDAETYSGRQKLAGYRKGLADCGLPEKSEAVVRCARTLAAAREAVEKIAGNVDAVLTSEDILAVGACKALASAGRQIPVIGFNNSVLAECSTPALTSVDNMVPSMCRSAVDTLMQLLAGESHVPGKIVVAATLVERETFRRAAGMED